MVSNYGLLQFKKSLATISTVVTLALSLNLEGVPYLSILELLILGMASILAIVISVGLLSVQLAASEYTPLVVRSKNNYSYIFKYFLIFIFSISFSLLSYLLISSTIPSESLRSELPLQLGASVFFATSVGIAVFAILTIQDIFEDTLSAIDRENILENISSEVSIEDVSDYLVKRESEGDAVRHPLLVVYIMAKEKLNEGDTHGCRESINHLTKATQNILLETENRDNTAVSEDGMKDLFEFWTDLGYLSVENDMRTISWYWISSFHKVMNTCLENAPAKIVERALSTYREVTLRIVAEIGLGDEPDELLYILEKSINKDRWDIFESSLSTSHAIISQGLRDRFSESSEELLNELFDSWGRVLEADISNSEKKKSVRTV